MTFIAQLSVKILVTEKAERDVVLRCRDFFRGLPVELQKSYNAHTDGNLEQALAETQKQVIDLGDLGVGLRLADLAEREAMTPAAEVELAVETVALLEQGSHDCTPKTFAISLRFGAVSLLRGRNVIAECYTRK